MTGIYRKQRANQFLPYAALRGFEELIEEETRVVHPRRELAEDEAEELSRTLCAVSAGNLVRVTFYAVDTYFTARGELTALDRCFRTLTVGGREVCFDDIYSLEICG